MNIYPDIQSLRVALSKEMKRHALTQIDICERTGVAQSAVSLFLNGHRTVNSDYALKIANLVLALERLPDPVCRPPIGNLPSPEVRA